MLPCLSNPSPSLLVPPCCTDDLAGVFVLMAIFMAVVLAMAALRYWKAHRRSKQLQVGGRGWEAWGGAVCRVLCGEVR